MLLALQSISEIVVKSNLPEGHLEIVINETRTLTTCTGNQKTFVDTVVCILAFVL